MDSKIAGMRCLAKKEIRTPAGIIQNNTGGVIQYDIENLGRRLIYVQWDNGISAYVYPTEIEIVSTERGRVRAD